MARGLSHGLLKGPSIKDIRFFWAILDLLTYLYPIFVPNFRRISLSICLHIPFLQTYLLTGIWDILYGWPLSLNLFLAQSNIVHFQKFYFNLKIELHWLRIWFCTFVLWINQPKQQPWDQILDLRNSRILTSK